MTDLEVVGGELPAGRFSTWLRATLATQAGPVDADVPCGDCTACCRSAYFIHVGPEDVAARRRIPRALLFPAPGRPKGHLVMGFDEHGRCPMLVEDRCSIYEDRPRACRSYDCRVFPAAGLSADDDGKPLIAERARRWRFDLPTALDEEQLAAVRAAAAFLGAHPECFAEGRGPRSASDLAAAAITTHGLFVGGAVPDPAALSRLLDGGAAPTG